MTKKILLLLASSLLMTCSASAQILEVYFIPIQEDFLQIANAEFAQTCGAANQPGDTVRSVVSIVANADNTIIYYDHWEDGFETDLNNPVQASTQIWGDNNPANGIPPGYVTDVLNAGAIITLDNNLSVSNLGFQDFDARDKIGATLPLAVTRAAWHITPGPVLSGSVEVQNVEDLGNCYIAPFGENTNPANGMFLHSYYMIQATEANTVVEVDADANGTAELTNTLQEGEIWLVTDFLEGSTVNANNPISVTVVAGDTGCFESRWFRMTPKDQWVSNYCSPIGTTQADDPAILYIHNAEPAAITVNLQTALGTTPLVVPAGQTLRYQYPLGSGGSCLTSAGGEPFYAAVTVDDSVSHDWGMTLIPECNTSSQLLVGWGPGSGDLSQNGSPIWVTAQTATSVYIDYDGDPSTGALIDPLGNRYDELQPLSAFGLLQVNDTSDNDMTGARLYTLDGTLLSGAWGQDPAVASPGNPFLDMGTTVLPVPILSLIETFTFTGDTDGDGRLDPGETATVTLCVTNTGLSSLTTVDLNVFFDPDNLLYATNTTFVDGVPIPDDTNGVSLFPLDEGQQLLGNLAPGDQFKVTYDLQVSPAFTNCDGMLDEDFVYTTTANDTCAGARLVTGLPQPADFDPGLTLFVEQPTNCFCAGEDVEVAITVSNSGTWLLDGIQVDSALFNTCDLTVPPLLGGETYTYTCTVSSASTVTDTITASISLCGTTNLATNAIVVIDVDTTPPSFTPPANVALECDIDPSTNVTGTVTDGSDHCDTNPVITFVDTETAGACPQEKIITRAWTVTDSCGNATTFNQLITVIDTTPPTFAVPTNVTIECDEPTGIANTGSVTNEADNCDSNPVVAFADTPVAGACPQEGSILREWTATDACGNSTVQTQTITIVDTTPPTFTLPIDVTIECDESTNTANTGSVGDPSDNCDPAPVVSFVDTLLAGPCPQAGSILRAWTATDACGNASTGTQTITIVNTTPPTFTRPIDVTIECDESTNTANTGSVVDEADNCDPAPVVTFVDNVLTGACPQAATILRVWSATDGCTNITVQTQTITIIDTTPPTFTLPADITIECDASTNTANTGEVTAEADNCDTNPAVAFADTIVPGACPEESDILRAWTVTDACGNVSSATQTITIVDTTPPTFTLPADITIECDATTNTINTGVVTAEADNCDTNPAVTFADTIVPGACPEESDILRAWTVTDACGNATTATQTITIVDTTPPTFTLPADLTIECDASTNTANTGVATTQSDNCDTNPVTTYADTIVPGACPEESDILRAWTVTDACGNATTATQTITIVDTTPPTFTLPVDLTIECDASTNTADTGVATTQSDNCDTNPVTTFADTIVPGACPQESDILRAWTVTDACGNATTAPQTITIIDTPPPTFTLPTDLTIECDASTNTANTGVVSAEADNCDTNPAVTFADTIVPGACPQESDIFRAWTVTDACGNGSTATQTITIVDTTPPAFTLPTDLTIECDASTNTANTGVVSAEADNCDTNPAVTFADTIVPGACPQEFDILRAWTVTDACGNATTATQTIMIVDTTAPTFTLPADITIECDASTNTINTGVVTVEADNCDTNPVTTFADTIVPGGCPQESDILRAWTVTDACGNATTATQTIIIVDTTAPTFTLPADLTIECDASTNTANTGVAITQSDNCDTNPATTFADTIVPGACPQESDILRAWTVTDACGNASTATQTITIVDTTPPSFTLPADLTIECDASTNTANTGVVTAEADNCDTNPAVTFADTIVPGACPQESDILRAWTVTDACGNASTATQTITIVDTTPPTFILPADLTIECDASTNTANTGVVTAEADNCDTNPAVTFADTIVPGACPQESDILRAWTVTDACGNASTATQTITIVDTTPPSFTLPADLTIECDASTNTANTGVVTAETDNCDTNPAVTFADTIVPGACPQESDILRAWTVTDACGNATTATQTISIVDTTAPTFTLPVDVTIECDASTNTMNTGSVTNEADNCDTNPVVTFIDTLVAGACANEGTILRAWTATDACGNATTATQTITIVDTTPPTFTLPLDVNIECSDSTNTVNTGAVSGQTDNCDAAPVAIFVDTLVAGGCPNEGEILRAWTVTDTCGNATTAVQKITIVDTTAPLFAAPVNVTIECDASTNTLATGFVTNQTDNCNTNPVVTFADAIVPGACPNEREILRAWTVTDACGNPTTITQTITVVDTSPPAIVCPSNYAVVADADCNYILPIIDPVSATDNCGTVTVTQVPAAGTVLSGPGPHTITLTATDACGNATPCSFELSLRCPAISIAKSVYLGHDGGASCPGNELATGLNDADVTYCIIVSNTGATVLANVMVVDNDIAPALNVNLGTLAVGAVTSIFVEAVIDGDLVNMASASGTPAEDDGTPLDSGPVTDNDTATVDEIEPSISIAKSVYLGHDGGASCPGVDFVSGTNNTTVTYCFVVTNTGDTVLSNVIVTDNLVSPAFSTNIGVLAIGATATVFVESSINIDLVNLADASGVPSDATGDPFPEQVPVEDEDTAEVDLIGPGMQLLKTVYYGHDGGASCPGTDLVINTNNAPVTYCFTVVNTGDTYLDNVMVNDNTISPPFAANLGRIAPSTSATVFVEDNVAGDLVNLAEASGIPSDENGDPIPGQPTIGDDDIAEVDEVAPMIAITKSVYLGHDNGVSCAAGAQMVTAQNGDPVTYCFLVQNTGDTPLADVMIVDNDLNPTFMTNVGTIPVGGSVTVFTEVAVSGDLINTAEATGTPTDENGEPIPDVDPPTDDDDAEVDEVNPSISIAKSVYLGHDAGASCPGVESVSAQATDDITYCFVVTNTGDTVLSSVTVTDNDIVPSVNIAIGILQIGATTTVYTQVQVAGDLTNTASASGIPSDVNGDPLPEQPPVDDDDTAEVDEINPSISIAKSVYWGVDGGGSCPGGELVVGVTGDAITYCFVVTNTGDTTLSGVTITDNDISPPVSITIGVLAPGAVALEFAESTITGDLINTASASGIPSDPAGNPLPEQPPETDNDIAEVDQVDPEISITKSVYLGHDGGASCPGSQAVTSQNGDAVTYCFFVENTGDTPLANVTVTDNDLTPAFSTNLGSLAVGDSVTVFTEVMVAGDLVNTASATGTPTDSNGDPLPNVDPPVANDDAEVDEINPSISIAKSVYLGHDNGASCPGIQSVSAQAGDDVTYCFTVTNTGDTVLSSVTVVDNDLSPAVNIVIGIMPIGASTTVYTQVQVVGDLVNTASASGVPSDPDGNPFPEQPPVEDEDSAEVDGVNPSISIAKSVYLLHDGGLSCPGVEAVAALAGDPVTYCFIVTNTGDTYLSGVTITDNDLTPAVNISVGLLAPGQVAIEHVEVFVAGDLTNTASATGIPSDPDGNPLPEQPPVGDEDDAEVDEINPSIAIAKTVALGHNGAASCPGVEFVAGESGDPVTYCFLVTNTGDTPLANVTITDNDLSPAVNLNLGLLPVGGSTNVAVASTIQGDLVNTASATGEPADENGDPLPEIPDPTDADTAEVDQIGPGIKLFKTVYIGHDGGASCPGADLATGDAADELTYCFLVENSGDAPLTNVSVTDPALGITLTVGFLPVGASTNLFIESTLAGDLVNTATATGTPSDPDGNPLPEQPPVTDDDNAEVDEVMPGIAIGKSVYLGHDNGASCPGNESVSAQTGDPVTYCFAVTNTGDTVLIDIMVIDNDLTPAVNLNLGTLQIGASTTVFVEVSVAGDLVNTASATGTPADENGNPLPDVDPPTAEDEAEVDEINPGIAITKSVYLGHDDGASCPGGPSVSGQVGEPVTYCFAVTNTGDTVLANVMVTDNDLTPAVAIPIGVLQIGASTTIWVEVSIAGDLVNTASASGTPADEDGNPLPEQPPEEDEDTAEVDQVGPGISISKSVYLGHDTGASCPGGEAVSALAGTAVTYCFIVTNTGDTYLSGVTITDNDLTPPVMISVGLMAPGDVVVEHVETTVAGDLVNNASASGTPSDPDGNPIPGQPPVGDVDDAVADEVLPGIAIEKSVYLGHDSGASCAGDQTVAGQSGDLVTYCFLVINTGDTPLANVMVTDNDVSPPVSINLGLIPVGTSSNVYLETTIQGDLVNTASATGTPAGPDGEPLPDIPSPMDEDTAEVDQIGPGIKIEKSVYIGHNNGADCPGTELATGDVGDDLTYCFLILNTGDAPLSGVTFSDADLGLVNVPVGFIPVGGATNLYVEASLAGDLVNTASATGIPSDENGVPVPGQPPVGDEDTAEVDAVMPGIAIAKSVYLGHDNGASCATAGQSVSAQNGEPVTYCFTVTNTGDTLLIDVMVIDNDLTPAVNMNLGTLAIGSSTTVFVEVGVVGDLVNTAQATGIPADEDGNPLPDVDPPVVEDTAEVDAIAPGISISKSIYLGHDTGASCPGTETVDGQAGDAVTYCFIVTNTGNTYLSGVTITDNDLTPAVLINVGLMAPGEVVVEHVESSIAGDLVNKAEASGTPSDENGNPIPGQPSVGDEDTAEVNEVGPAISISKSVYVGHDNGESCPGGGSVNGQSGTPVTYCFVVVNSGDTYLANVTITDNDLTPPVSINVGLMAPGQIVTEHVETSLVADLVNKAGASGTPSDENGNPLPGQPPVGAEDTAEVDLINPGIGLAKELQSVVNNGDGTYRVSFEFTIQNMGDVPLSDLILTDDIGSQFAGMNPSFLAASDGSLDANPSWNGGAASNILEPGQSLPVGTVGNVFASFTVTPGSRSLATNVAEVVGTDPTGNPVTDISTSGLQPDPNSDGTSEEEVPTLVPFTENPRIDVTKELVDITSTGTTFTATFKFLVANTGDVILRDLELIDNLTSQFAAYSPSGFTATSGSLNANPAWAGTATSNVLEPGQSLMPGAQGNVTATFSFISTKETTLDNVATIKGTSPAGTEPTGEDTVEVPVEFPPANLSGTIWEDSSADGLVDEDLDVFGLGDVTVFLYLVNPDGSEVLIDSVPSERDGSFVFTDLPPGTYRTDIDEDQLPPVLVNRSTPFSYISTLVPGEGDQTHIYGLFPAPTAIELEFFEAHLVADGVALKWRTAWEQDSLGFFVYKVAPDGSLTQLNATLILSHGGGDYALNLPEETGGRYILEEIETDLDRTFQSIVAYTRIDAAPVGEPTLTFKAEETPVPFTSSIEYDTYLVSGLDFLPQVLDVTDPVNPLELVGEILSTPSENAAYFSAPADREILVQEREVIIQDE